MQLEDIRISSDNLVMAAPKYSGNGKDGSRHSVRARSAETDLLSRNRVKLTAIEGEIIQLNGTRIDLTATRGTYEQEAGVLELHEQIDVRSTDGMTANLTAATIFTKENRIVSNEPVTALMPTGSVRARAMELKTKQRNATFTGDVAVRMVPQQKPATATETAAADEAAKAVGKPKKDKVAANALGPSFSSGEPVDVTSDRLIVDDATHLASSATTSLRARAPPRWPHRSSTPPMPAARRYPANRRRKPRPSRHRRKAALRPPMPRPRD